MKKQPHLDEHTWQAMEACRWGTADSHDPDLRTLISRMAASPEIEKISNRIELIDQKIGAAFQDVSVPPGLAQSILDHLSHAGNPISATDALKDEPVQEASANYAVAPASLPPPGKLETLRRWTLISSGILSAAVLFFALWLNLFKGESYTEQTIFDEAIRFFQAGAPSGRTPWAEKSPPKTFPFSRAVFFSNGICWRVIRDFLGQSGLAYDLPNRDGGRATLYVIRKSLEGLPNEPQYYPFTTGGFSTSAWQEGGLLYVLVVQGEPNTYQKYLNLPRGPVA